MDPIEQCRSDLVIFVSLCGSRAIKYIMKHYKTVYILWGSCGLLVLLLIWEYYSLRMQVAKVYALQDQYYGYIDSVKRMLRKQKAQHDDGVMEVAVDDEDDADSFLLIDRRPAYLKESALSYVKDQQLDSLLNQINMHEWDEYTEQVLRANRQQPKITSGNTGSLKKSRLCFTSPRWYSKRNRRASLTGITFHSPIEPSRFWLSSFFGSRKKPNGQIGFHQGIDMAAQRGTAVQAVASGTVEYAGYASGYGNTILIAHDAVYKTRYAHLDAIYVRANQRVEPGKKIGAVGDTGFTIKKGKDASHLHFELYERGKQVNPLVLLSL